MSEFESTLQIWTDPQQPSEVGIFPLPHITDGKPKAEKGEVIGLAP